MGIGVSLVVIAIGAVLEWAVQVSGNHVVDIHTVGLILMIVGAAGFVLSVIFWSSWGGPGGAPWRRRTTYQAPDGRTVVRDEIV